MRKRSILSRRDSESSSVDELNLTPLIDMVFILLIFFLVTTSFIRESSVDIQRPKAESANPQQNAEVIVTISSDEQIWLNDVSTDIRLLRNKLHALGLSGEARTAVILADAKASTGLLVKVMDQLRLSGFENISVAASSDPNE